ncbi:MAG TPA: hypothetical protein VEB21_08910, partial [Terriglobales bacterium]|nr:hypothetical protein [Terriglobales bacterium]
FAGVACAQGEECVDDPNDECDPSQGGADCIGHCRPLIEPACQSDQDCPTLPIPCSTCPDGTELCAESHCHDGRCAVAYPSCPAPIGCDQDPSLCAPEQVCKVYEEHCEQIGGNRFCPSRCVPAEDQPRRCGGSFGATCPAGWHCGDEPMDGCEPDANGTDCAGICVPDQQAQCRSDEECPHVLAPCTACNDGSHACPRGQCRNGVCEVVIDSCRERDFCGGIAGIPCRDGFECIDDPADDCDPNAGGADCGGVCVPREQAPPQCSGDADCAGIFAPCRPCEDGQSACPEAHCANGQCLLAPASCE